VPSKKLIRAKRDIKESSPFLPFDNATRQWHRFSMRNKIEERVESTESALNPVENFIATLGSLSTKELKTTEMKLKYLCDNFNPFDQYISNETENILNEFSLMNFTKNPYEFTNILLQLIDKLENQIKSKLN
jgi:hypothetical protein